MIERKLHFSCALLPSGWQRDVVLAVDEEGMIGEVRTGESAQGGTPIAGIAIPGMANVHSHAHQRAMTGLAERSGSGPDSFWTWREKMYAFALKIGPDDLQSIAAQLYVEALKSGFTAIGEFHYLHHAPDGHRYSEPAELSLRCLEAARDAGIAITLLPTLYSFGGFQGQAATQGQRRFVNDADGFLKIVARCEDAARFTPHAQVGVALHSLRAVNQDLVSETLKTVDPHAPVHIHVAEQLKEVEECIGVFGRRPVELLMEWQQLSQRWCLIHATHMTERETKNLAASHAVAGLCPTTEANLGDGIFNAKQFLESQGTIGIGSDSHICVSPAEELRQLEYSQRLFHHARNVLAAGPQTSTGRSLFEAALRGGAKALRQPQGALEKGMRADIVVLDGDYPALIGREDDAVLDSWIFSGGNACVRDVYVGGLPVVRNRVHIKEAEIRTRFGETLARLQE